MQLISHLFKKEHGKLVSVLSNNFGLAHIEIAEDIVSETFLTALHIWPYKGVPDNPTGWLYEVAKNKLKNQIIRDNTFRDKVLQQLQPPGTSELSLDFSDQAITDSQLRLLFAVCHPSITEDSQICLALRSLCGLGLGEIADAFMSNKEAIHKKLQRAKEKLKSENVSMQMPAQAEISARLQTVLKTIYLLFSEGYYSEQHESVIRQELCIEAINLAFLLLNSPSTNTHATHSLLSLMCFQASRLEARKSYDGELILYADQDRNRWNQELIEKGFHYLQIASQWKIESPYYVEASIAYWHTVEERNPDKWPSILKLYDALIAINPSPIAALNRLWAFSKLYGNQKTIEAAANFPFQHNKFYLLLMAELHQSTDMNAAKKYLSLAFDAAKTESEKALIKKKIESL